MKNALSLLFCLLILGSARGQGEFLFKFDHLIQSEAFNDERKISVYLPPSYYENPDAKFTVSYVLDGQFDPFIDLVVKTLEYNTYMYKYTPTIVVGIHAKNRGWEFSAPVPGDEKQDYNNGRAPELQQHFKNEIFPLIDSLYKKTMPFRTIIGHSSGGAFVLYNLFSDGRDLFDAYIGISPGIREDDEYILNNAIERLKAGEQFNKFLYCSNGTVGTHEKIFGTAMNRLDSIFQAYPDHGLIWRKETIEGMGHWTCVGPSLNNSMVALTRAFRTDEKILFDFAEDDTFTMTEQLITFYKEKEDKYGFVEIPEGGYLSNVAFELLELGHGADAIEMIDWGLTMHPDHYKLSKTRAKMFMYTDREEEAIAAFKSCFDVLEAVKHKLSEEAYQDQKKYLNEKIEKLTK